MQRTILLRVAMFLTVALPTAFGQDVRSTRPILGDAETYSRTGLDHYQSGRYREAVEALRQAALLKPTDPVVYYNLGMADVQLGYYLDSTKSFREAIRLNPEYSAAYSKLGALYNYFGQYREAAQLLKQALRFQPGVDVYNNLGIAYYRLGRYQESIETLKYAISLAPNITAPYVNLANTYQKLGRLKEADETRQQVARLSAPVVAAAATGRPDTIFLTANVATPALRGQVNNLRLPGNSLLIIKDDVKAKEVVKAAEKNTQAGAGGSMGAAAVATVAAKPSSQPPRVQSQPKETASPKSASPVIAAPAASTSANAAVGAGRSANENSQANPIARPAANTAAAASRAPDPGIVLASETMGDAALTRIYRVGAGDILDIHLLNAATQGSTLFTVLPSGLLDYPLAGEPLSVAGLTTDDIKTRLAAKIKIYDRPLVDVGVREYASHTVIVNGLVGTPGAKVLRREAVPLYVIMAEAEPKPEAARIRVNRLTGESALVELDAAEAMNTLVHPGDVVTVLARPSQFYYIGGEVKEPGEKSYRSGITLTQALLASGGLSRGAGGVIKVARQGADGRLITNRYNVKEIYSGKTLDPVVEAGDRIDVSR